MEKEDVSLIEKARATLRAGLRRKSQAETPSFGPPGKSGEDLAAAHLRREGLEVLSRNYRCRGGELDLVARDKDGTVVFVEVKERRTGTHGEGFEAVGPGKRRRLLRAAEHYASRHGLYEASLRFDVVSVTWEGEKPRLRWDRGAFDANGR
jgi:putative endonuclease